MTASALQVNEDVRFERTESTISRIGWILMGIFLCLGLAGFLGRGPLSNAHVDVNNLKVDYHRFLRKGADAEFAIRANAQGKAEHKVWFNNEFLDKVEINRIDPVPKSSVARDEGVEYAFASTSDATPDIIVHFEPQSWGKIKAQVSDGSAEKADLNLIVYP
jgi:hypothetical protein